MGINPATPIVPDTEETLAIRRQKEPEARQANVTKANRHARSSTSVRSQPISMPPSPPHHAQTQDVQSTITKTPTPAQVEDNFLKQIRQAREAMAEETEWLRQQSATIEQEIEQEEECRRSPSNREADSPRSSSGLAKVNGYDYLPSDTKSGFSLSRTERRIRQTGAHGLATKPLRTRSGYVHVAMSKRSALNYSSGSHPSPDRKRSHDDITPPVSIRAAARNADALRASKKARAEPHHAAVGSANNQKPRPSPRGEGPNPYHLLQGDDEEEEEEDIKDDEHDTKELYDEADESLAHFHHSDGDYADDDDEDIDEFDENEGSDYGAAGEEYDDEEDDLDEDGQPIQHPALYLQGPQDDYEDAATPVTNPQISRAASSAPGGSADDAFLIDDSD